MVTTASPDTQTVLGALGIDDYFVQNCIEWAHMPRQIGTYIKKIKLNDEQRRKLLPYSDAMIRMTVMSKFQENREIKNVVVNLSGATFGNKRVSVELTIFIRYE